MTDRVHNRNGYDASFLSLGGGDFDIALPQPIGNLASDVLKLDFAAPSNAWIDYINYSVLMSKSTRQALASVAIASADPALTKAFPKKDKPDGVTWDEWKGRKWFIDDRVGKENQIPNKPYQGTMWDRGHLTRRSAVAWGDNPRARRAASNDSCAYTNSCMQHKYFNEDDWRIIERAVSNGKQAGTFGFDARNKRMIVMTGPIFTATDRYFSFGIGDTNPTRIPGGFWKLVSFVVETDTGPALRTRAFISFQDRDAMANDDDESSQTLDSYMVTTTEVQHWTGLEFDQKMYASNDLTFHGEDGIDSFRVADIKKLNKPDHALTDVRIADSDAIKAARRKLNQEAFYNLIEDISWV